LTSSVFTPPIVAQGVIEHAFPGPGPDACTDRVRFKRAHGESSAGDGFYLKRGILAGAIAEQELDRFAHGHGFSLDLGGVVDQELARMRLGPASGRAAEMRTDVIRWVRELQARFPNPDIDLGDIVPLLPPQTDLFLRRPERFVVRVRPDLVLGMGDAIVAFEFSTAKSLTGISPARFALNHHALAREVLQRSEWRSQFKRVITHVEMLALGESSTVALEPEDAERWRVDIGNVAEAIQEGRFEANAGPWCTLCPWVGPCRLDGATFNDDSAF
jgi:hypothetical protein